MDNIEEYEPPETEESYPCKILGGCEQYEHLKVTARGDDIEHYIHGRMRYREPVLLDLKEFIKFFDLF